MTPADILAAVRAGRYAHAWADVISHHAGHVARFRVSADALRIDGVRVAVSAHVHQHIADLLGVSMLTEHLAMLAHEQADTEIEPQTSTDYAHMTEWPAIVAHSQRVDAALAAHGGVGLLASNVGKDWILANALDGARSDGGDQAGCNFGWFKRDGSVWQPAATRHSSRYYDYSQVARFVALPVWVDEFEMWDLRELAVDPERCGLVTGGGPLHVLRQPGVEVAA